MKRSIYPSAIIALALFMQLIVSCGDNSGSEEQEDNAQNGSSTSREEMIKKGEHLVISMACDDCHSPKIFTEKGPIPDENLRLSGHPANLPLESYDKATVKRGWVLGNAHLTAWVGPWGTSFTANLTPDTLTGIGVWSEEQFFRAIREGKFHGLPASRTLLPPMPWPAFKNLTDEELRSVFTYLKSIRPVRNAVPAPIPPTGS